MIYGYARCSTSESKQDINRQIKELKAVGAEEVIFEYEHGDAKTKPELAMLLELTKSGDTMISPLMTFRLSTTARPRYLIPRIRNFKSFWARFSATPSKTD